VHVCLRQKAPPHRFARAALEEHVVWHDDGRAAVLLQNGPDVL